MPYFTAVPIAFPVALKEEHIFKQVVIFKKQFVVIFYHEYLGRTSTACFPNLNILCFGNGKNSKYDNFIDISFPNTSFQFYTNSKY